MTVLRLAHLYHIPKSLEDADNLPAGMCIEALRDGAVRADESHEFSLLHENDAVEYIYRAIHKQEHQYDIYHLSSANAVSEVKLAGLIRQSMNRNIGISLFQVLEDAIYWMAAGLRQSMAFRSSAARKNTFSRWLFICRNTKPFSLRIKKKRRHFLKEC